MVKQTYTQLLTHHAILIILVFLNLWVGGCYWVEHQSLQRCQILFYKLPTSSFFIKSNGENRLFIRKMTTLIMVSLYSYSFLSCPCVLRPRPRARFRSQRIPLGSTSHYQKIVFKMSLPMTVPNVYAQWIGSRLLRIEIKLSANWKDFNAYEVTTTGVRLAVGGGFGSIRLSLHYLYWLAAVFPFSEPATSARVGRKGDRVFYRSPCLCQRNLLIHDFTFFMRPAAAPRL